MNINIITNIENILSKYEYGKKDLFLREKSLSAQIYKNQIKIKNYAQFNQSDNFYGDCGDLALKCLRELNINFKEVNFYFARGNDSNYFQSGNHTFIIMDERKLGSIGEINSNSSYIIDPSYKLIKKFESDYFIDSIFHSEELEKRSFSTSITLEPGSYIPLFYQDKSIFTISNVLNIARNKKNPIGFFQIDKNKSEIIKALSIDSPELKELSQEYPKLKGYIRLFSKLNYKKTSNQFTEDSVSYKL